MKRTLALLALAMTPFVVSAQIPDEASVAVRDAFKTLSSSSSIRVRMSGTETIGSASIPVVGELYWSLGYEASGAPLAKVEYNEYRDGYLVQRSVGDGKTFYCYSPFKNEYWVASYGTHGPTTPARYLANLVDDLTASMKGSATYLARLLRETYVVNGFRAWIPGANENLLVDGEGAYFDPLVKGRTFIATSSVEYGLFWFGNPVKKSLAFEFALGSATGRELKRIYYAELSSVQAAPRLIEWRADLFTNFIPAATNFVFIPPANARVIVGPRPNIG